MMLVNLFILFIPVLASMAMLWVHCACMDNLPKHAFELKRVHLRWGLVSLILVLVVMACFMVMSVDMIQVQYYPPELSATLQLNR